MASRNRDELIQDAGGTEIAGMGGSISGAKDRSADVGLASNLLGLGTTEMEIRSQRQAKRELESAQKFLDINARVGQEFSTNVKGIIADSGGALSEREAADIALRDINKNPNAFIETTTGRADFSDEEKAKFLGSAYFKGLSEKLSQGYGTETAVMIAAERQVKTLIAKRPDLADHIRKMAADTVGFDPTGEYKAVTSRFKEQRPERKLTPIEEALINAEASVMSDNRVPESDKAFRVQEKRNMILDNYDRELKVESIEQRTKAGVWNFTQASNESYNEFVQKVVPDFSSAILTAVERNGLDLGAGKGLAPPLKADLEFSLSGLENAEFRRQQNLAAAANTPFNAENIRSQISEGTKPIREFLNSKDAAKQLQAYNELMSQNNKKLTHDSFSQVMLYREAFGEQYVDMLSWMASNPAGQKWAADNKVLEITGVRTGDARTLMDAMSKAQKAFSTAAGYAPQDLVLGKVPPAPEGSAPRKGISTSVSAFDNGAPVDDATFAGIISDAIVKSEDASRIVSAHIRNRPEGLTEGQKRYLSNIEAAALSPTSHQQQVEEALSSAVMGVPFASKDPEFLSKIDKVYINNEGILSVDYYDKLGRKNTRAGVWSKPYANAFKITTSLAGSDQSKTGIASRSQADVVREVNKGLAAALEEVRISSTLVEQDTKGE